MNQTRSTNIVSKYRYLFLLLLLSAFVGFYGIDKNAIDGDEAVTANDVTGFGYIRNCVNDGFRVYPRTEHAVFSSAEYWERNKVARVVKYTMNDQGHSLPYNVLVHYWINLTGFSVAALRWPSAIFALLSALFFYQFVRKTFQDRSVANLATLFFVLHPLVIQLAHFARMYTLALFLLTVILALCKGLETSEKEGRKWRGFFQATGIGLVSGLALMTHYFTGLAMGGLFFFYVFQVNKANLRRAIAIAMNIFIPFAIVMLIYFFPLGALKGLQWVKAMNKLAETQYILGMEKPELSLAVWSFICRITTSFGNSTASDWEAKSIINVLLLVFPLLIVALNLKAARKQYGNRNVSMLLWGFLVYIVLAALTIPVVKNMVIMHARYWVFCLPFSLPLLAVCIRVALSQEKSAARMVTIFALAVVLLRMSYTLVMYVNDVRSTGNVALHGDPREQSVRVIVAGYQPGDTISYKNWYYSQQENWFLKDHPQFIQKVDTLQRAKIVLLSGGKQQVVSQ